MELSTNQMKKLTVDEFWEIKHQIDDGIKRIGWSKAQAKDYIKGVYDKSSRLSMTDEQLIDFLNYIRSFCRTKSRPSVSSTRRKNTKRRRI